MGFFNRNFDRPGPGVAKDAPRKTGAARFFEVLGRDYGSFFKASLLCILGYLPWTLLVGIGVLGQNMIFTLVGGLVGGVIAGPALAGMHDTVLRSLRDEPGYWWHVYKRAFKNNWRASMAPGALLGVLTAGQLFMFWCLTIGLVSLDLVSTALLAPKASRTTQGVGVMTLKPKYQLETAVPLQWSTIRDIPRYRVKTLPAAGALLREADRGEEQLSLMEE